MFGVGGLESGGRSGSGCPILSKRFPNSLKSWGFQVIMRTEFFQFWSMMAHRLLSDSGRWGTIERGFARGGVGGGDQVGRKRVMSDFFGGKDWLRAGGCGNFSLLARLLPGFLLCVSLLAQSSPGQGADKNDLLPKLPLYAIQPSDKLEVFVWKEPDLSRNVVVRPDGRISVPLIQDVDAAGLSTEELKEKIEAALSEFLEAPNVTVIVEAIQSYQVFVIGQVQKPGSIRSDRPLTVLQALALAGGFSEYADQGDIRIIRSYGTENVTYSFNYKDVVKGKNSNQNIVLRTGDVVSVP